MIRLPDRALADAASRQLADWQATVNAHPGFDDRVAAAKSEFARRNRRGERTFDEVKRTLDSMCSGARRCCYCEDSAADEVEHVRPKDWFPEFVFAWSNYLYACGPCNGPKNSQFAVFETGRLAHTTLRRPRGAPIDPPPAGESAFIDPRVEDPMGLMTLDVIDTFLFVPSWPPGTREHERARYTIDVLHLSDRDVLIRARREAFGSYRARLEEYVGLRDRGAPEQVLVPRVRDLKRMQHPTVWREMKRQRERLTDLAQLFASAPEALDW